MIVRRDVMLAAATICNRLTVAGFPLSVQALLAFGLVPYEPWLSSSTRQLVGWSLHAKPSDLVTI